MAQGEEKQAFPPVELRLPERGLRTWRLLQKRGGPQTASPCLEPLSQRGQRLPKRLQRVECRGPHPPTREQLYGSPAVWLIQQQHRPLQCLTCLRRLSLLQERNPLLHQSDGLLVRCCLQLPFLRALAGLLRQIA